MCNRVILMLEKPVGTSISLISPDFDINQSTIFLFAHRLYAVRSRITDSTGIPAFVVDCSIFLFLLQINNRVVTALCQQHSLIFKFKYFIILHKTYQFLSVLRNRIMLYTGFL